MKSLFLAAAVALGASACTVETDDVVDALAIETEPTVVDLAVSDPNLSTLVKALQRAGLDGALADRSGGTFTVFAPTNAAFEDAGIDVDTVDLETLKAVLTYHVVPGIAKAADIGTGTWGTLNGAFVKTKTAAGKVTLDGVAAVTTADIEAANGVVHVIDAVLTPPTADLVALLAGRAEFSELVAALEATGLDEALAGEGPFTVFAPTNDAFAAVTATTGTLTTEQLADVLKFHVVPGRNFSTDLTTGDLPTLLDDKPVAVDVDALTISGANLIPESIDIQATNGVVHAVDAVLIP